MKKTEKTPVQQLQIDLNPETTPILYTDNAFIHMNDYGVVIDFSQKMGPSNRAKIVSRVGMSREHTKKFVQELGKILAMTEDANQTGKRN